MKSNLLLPNRFKTIGWLLFAVGILFGIGYILNYIAVR